MAEYTIFDTETTDLISNLLLPLDRQPRVYEFFATRIAIPDDNSWPEEGDWTVVGELEFLCHPGIKIPEMSTKITGITDEMVKDCPPFPEFFERVRDIFAGAIPVAHNLSYDRDMINLESRRITGKEFEWSKRGICTVEATEHLKGHRLNLSALHELLFGEKFEGAHRAREDVAALTRCFKKLMADAEL